MEGTTFYTVFPIAAAPDAPAITLSIRCFIVRSANMGRRTGKIDDHAANGSAARAVIIKNDVVCTSRMPDFFKGLITSVGASDTADDIGNCF